MKNLNNNGSRFSPLRAAIRQLSAGILVTAALLGSAQAATDEVVYFHTDALGSPVAAFNEAGAVCWTESYSPYGEKLVNDDNAPPWDGCGLIDTSDVAYTGHVQDGSGLVYAQQRYYDPQIGRFMSTDPIGPSSGAPHMFGRYQYANNSPYVFTDPTGMIGDNEAAEEGGSYACSACGAISDQNPNGGVTGNFGGGNGSDDSIEPVAITGPGVVAQAGADFLNNPTWGGFLEAILGRFRLGKVAKGKPKEGIYEFPDLAAGGKPYVGQSSNIPARLKQHEKAGRLKPGTEKTTEVLGGKTAREVAEHGRIQEKTGGIPARFSPNVSNKKDPIGPARQHLLN